MLKHCFAVSSTYAKHSERGVWVQPRTPLRMLSLTCYYYRLLHLCERCFYIDKYI